MFKDDIVTIDELYAVAAPFTLLVWAFTLAYSVCQQIYQGGVLAAAIPHTARSWIELLFMGFSIQSSTGVGDVPPISGPARLIHECIVNNSVGAVPPISGPARAIAIAALQIFSGVMYIAIVISRLVGLAANKNSDT